jgi:quercetin 2,3-dioxygenase
MIEHRPFHTLGSVERDWLRARLHIRFGEIGPPGHAPVGALRIWNDDEFAPHSGFGLHAHQDIEIVTFVRTGAITHEDNFGNKARIEADHIQTMSAGTGVLHAERNDEPEPARVYQLWLTPRSAGGEPRWATMAAPRDARQGQFAVLASGDPRDVRAGALAINADARLSVAALRTGQTLVHTLAGSGDAYLVSATGRLDAGAVRLAARDGAAISGERQLVMKAVDHTSIFLMEALGPARLARG